MLMRLNKIQELRGTGNIRRPDNVTGQDIPGRTNDASKKKTRHHKAPDKIYNRKYGSKFSHPSPVLPGLISAKLPPRLDTFKTNSSLISRISEKLNKITKETRDIKQDATYVQDTTTTKLRQFNLPALKCNNYLTVSEDVDESTGTQSSHLPRRDWIFNRNDSISITESELHKRNACVPYPEVTISKRKVVFRSESPQVIDIGSPNMVQEPRHKYHKHKSLDSNKKASDADNNKSIKSILKNRRTCVETLEPTKRHIRIVSPLKFPNIDNYSVLNKQNTNWNVEQSSRGLSFSCSKDFAKVFEYMNEDDEI